MCASITIQFSRSHDLEISQAQGIWATLPKNKDKVNRLFDGSSNLYAFFSVNGSGAFQGYARVECGVGRELTDTEWLKADGASTWGEVFRVQWLVRCPLAFKAIPASLTNPLNEHKHVRIGFDGTQVAQPQGAQLRKLMDAQAAAGAEGADTRTQAAAAAAAGNKAHNRRKYGAPPQQQQQQQQQPFQPYNPRASAPRASSWASAVSASASAASRSASSASLSNGQPPAPQRIPFPPLTQQMQTQQTQPTQQADHDDAHEFESAEEAKQQADQPMQM